MPPKKKPENKRPRERASSSDSDTPPPSKSNEDSDFVSAMTVQTAAVTAVLSSHLEKVNAKVEASVKASTEATARVEAAFATLLADIKATFTASTRSELGSPYPPTWVMNWWSMARAQADVDSLPQLPCGRPVNASGSGSALNEARLDILEAKLDSKVSPDPPKKDESDRNIVLGGLMSGGTVLIQKTVRSAGELSVPVVSLAPSPLVAWRSSPDV
jgi:hypothetical protein